MMTYLDDSLDVSMTFGVVDRPQFGGSLTMLVVALEDTTGTLTLASNNSSHLVVLICYKRPMRRANFYIILIYKRWSLLTADIVSRLITKRNPMAFVLAVVSVLSERKPCAGACGNGTFP